MEGVAMKSDQHGHDHLYLFVYGTLRPPQDGSSPGDSRLYPEIAPYVVATIAAQLPGADLFDLGAYPGARPGAGIIVGDLLTVTPVALTLADRMEGHPQFFRRERVTVQTATGHIDAWIYWAPEAIVTGRPRIPGGDWLRRGGNCE
jgi:gamma-glutamylcyclotransferase (GGCT)/AIG2-like uncharacterized protein YtfP